MHRLSGPDLTSKSFDGSSVSSDDLERLQDSVSRRRRHAVYFHRPPVWRYSSFQDDEDRNSSIGPAFDTSPSFCSLDFTRQQNLPLEVADTAACTALYDSDSDQETPLLGTGACHSQLTLLDARLSSRETVPDSFRQTKPVFCTRLQSYRDIRLGLGEQWAICEGSLVVGLEPQYTLLDCREKRMDEFSVAGGDLYVVCSLYADLWALCAKASFNAFPKSDDPMRLAFLPLCAVTLAQNYSAFIRRSSRCTHYSDSNELRYPGNGLPVMPPQRSHSLTASKQIFRGHETQVSLPLMVYNAFQNLSLESTDTDFVPLDSTLEPIFSGLASRRRRLLSGIGSGKNLLKFRDSGRRPMRWRNSYDRNSSLSSVPYKVSHKSDGWRQLRKERRSCSGASLTLRWLSRKS